jgi:hypothetical protein
MGGVALFLKVLSPFDAGSLGVIADKHATYEANNERPF